MANSFTNQKERFEQHLEEELKGYPNQLKRVLRNKILYSHFDTDEDFKKYVQEAKELYNMQVSSDEILDGMAGLVPGASARKQLNSQLKTQKEDNTLIDEVYRALKI